MAYGNYNPDWQSGGKAPKAASFADTLKRPMRGRTMANRWDRAFGREGQRSAQQGRSAEEDAMQRMRDFDAYTGARRQAQAMSDELYEDWQNVDLGLQGQLAARGQIRSGVGATQQYDLADRYQTALQRGIAGLSMDAERLNQQNTRDLWGAGYGSTGRYLDILAGQRDADFMERNLRMQEKANNPWLRLGEAALGAGGRVLGGWLGGM